jgi:N-acetylglucosaminyl-diphospho-decaprenol L-rhamnosyltransferase
MDKLRIQIVDYKTRSYLIECLSSLSDDLATFQESYSVAILDNASGDDLTDIPAMFPRLQKVEIIQGEKNLGFGGGHNLLTRSGDDAEFLLLLNPDTRIIQPKTTERLLARARTLPADVIGPRLITPQGTTQWWDHGELHGLRAWIALNSGNSYWREQTTSTDVAWVSGAVFLIRKSRFDELGGFDERFFLYKEEEELCWRLREKEGRVLYDPTISVFHHGGVVAKKSEHMQKSVDYFLQKHFSRRLSYPLLKLLNKLMH